MAKKRKVYNKAPEDVSDKVYRIEFKGTSQDMEEARREFNKIYAAVRYQKEHYYRDLAILMGLSNHESHMIAQVNANKGKRGRPKREFRQRIPLGRGLEAEYETDLHIHLYIAGYGSSVVAQQIREKYNAEQDTENPYMPYFYVRWQALGGYFRAVDCDPFLKKDQRYEWEKEFEENRFKSGFDYGIPDA